MVETLNEPAEGADGGAAVGEASAVVRVRRRGLPDGAGGGDEHLQEGLVGCGREKGAGREGCVCWVTGWWRL